MAAKPTPASARLHKVWKPLCSHSRYLGPLPVSRQNAIRVQKGLFSVGESRSIGRQANPKPSGVSSNEPNGAGSQVDGGEEVTSSFIVAGGESAEEFEFGEEVLDQMAGFVEVFVVEALLFAIGFGRNDRKFPGFLQGFQHPPVGIEAFVGDHRTGFDLRQEHIGAVQVAGLPPAVR